MRTVVRGEDVALALEQPDGGRQVFEAGVMML